MNRTTLTTAGLLAALLIGIPALADSIAPGILLPKKNTKSISFSPKGSSDIFLLGIMPQGSSVKKGESVAQADFRILDKSIEDYERTIKSKNLEVLKLRYALDQQKERSALALQKYQTALTRTEEDQKDFLEKRKARMLAEEEERVNKALRHMSYKQEELNQLTKMYKDDQVAEETEEIILKRLKNELGESEFAVQGAKLVAELAKLRNIHRLGEDYATAVKEKQMDLEQARKQADFDLEQKKIALTEAEVSLRRLQDKYNELKADREMAAFKAPENGILLYGGYVADKWVAIPVAEKLKPGGKLEAFDKIATIVPPNSELIVQATLPDSTATPKVGEAVVIKVTNMQIPGVITEASPIPGADGKRRIIITPKVPASQIFAPGLPVQVTIKDQQGALRLHSGGKRGKKGYHSHCQGAGRSAALPGNPGRLHPEGGGLPAEGTEQGRLLGKPYAHQGAERHLPLPGRAQVVQNGLHLPVRNRPAHQPPEGGPRRQGRAGQGRAIPANHAAHPETGRHAHRARRLGPCLRPLRPEPGGPQSSCGFPPVCGTKKSGRPSGQGAGPDGGRPGRLGLLYV